MSIYETRVELPKRLVSEVRIAEGDNVFLYRAKIFNMSFSSKTNIWAHVELTKFKIVGQRTKRLWFFSWSPLRLGRSEPREVPILKKIWLVRNETFSTLIIHDNTISNHWQDSLVTYGMNHYKFILSKDLLDRAFGKILEEVLGIQQQAALELAKRRLSVAA